MLEVPASAAGAEKPAEVTINTKFPRVHFRHQMDEAIVMEADELKPLPLQTIKNCSKLTERPHSFRNCTLAYQGLGHV